jgi:outer membrane receptor protein involved in Fe transport
MRTFHRITFACALLASALTLASVAQQRGFDPSQIPANGVITGTVIDADSRQIVPSATVALYSVRDSSLVTGTVTQNEGTFELSNLRAGRYYVRISFIGYAPKIVGGLVLHPDAWTAALGNIELESDATMLANVEVEAERSQVTFGIDRTIYSTRDQPVTAGGNASDVLTNVPSVEVDVDGNVSLRGNANVAVMINGKPAPVTGEFLANFLKQLPANTIDRVEVMPNPSAKYDPDGMAGIINIVLAEDTRLNPSGALSLEGGTNEEWGLSGNINLPINRLSVFLNYGYRDDNRNSYGSNFRDNRYDNTFLDQNSDDISSNFSHVLNSTIDYKFSRITELSVSGMVSLRDGEDQGSNIYRFYDAAELMTDGYRRLSEESDARFNTDASLTLRNVWVPSDHELKTEVRYNQSQGDERELLWQEPYEMVLGKYDDASFYEAQDSERNDDRFSAQTDYIRNFGDRWKLETGAKFDSRGMFSDLVRSRGVDETTLIRDETLSNSFDYRENITAAYLVGSGKRGALSYQFGLRAEMAQTQFDLATTGEAFDNSYESLFPSGFLTYNLTEGKQLKLQYTKRIERPRTWYMNPFPSFSDPLNVRQGNPYLEPEYIHAFETGYQSFSRNGSFSLSPYFRRTINVIKRNKTVDPTTGISTMTFKNLATDDNYGLEVIASRRIGRTFNAFANFNAYRVVTDGSNVDTDLTNAALGWSTRINATWTAMPGTTLQAFLFYRAPMDTEQGRISAWSMANVAVRQSLLGDKGSLSVRLSDPFDTMGFNFVVDNDLFYQDGRRKWQSRVLKVSLTYSFGDQSNMRRRDQNRGGGMDMGGGGGDVGID